MAEKRVDLCKEERIRLPQAILCYTNFLLVDITANGMFPASGSRTLPSAKLGGVKMWRNKLVEITPGWREFAFNDWPLELKSEANFLTDAMELRSNSIASTLAVGISFTNASSTCLPAAIFLTPMTTWAPRSAKTRAVSRPIPLDPPQKVEPVTMAVRPEASIPSVTCSAVEFCEKPDGPGFLNSHMFGYGDENCEENKGFYLLFLLLALGIVESSIKRQQKPKKIKPPKHHISNRKPSSHIQPSNASMFFCVFLHHLVLHPFQYRKHPHGIINHRHKNPYRKRKPAGKRHPLHEHLTRQQKNMGRSCFDTFFIPFQNAVKYSDQSSDGDVDGEEAFVVGEHGWIRVGGERRKSYLRDEEHVEEGEEYEGEVFDADHAGGGEDDD
ncbi:hypothetical protein LXL04_021653 [Taraxacum kok-saghyz]